MNETAEMEATGLHPILRARGGKIDGIPLRVDDADWLLAHGGASTFLDPFRDRMDDTRRLKDEVKMLDVYEVARLCLLSNYELDEEEIIGLLLRTEEAALVKAVLAALFGDPGPHLTYSIWMRTSLLANGLDPEAIPAGMVPHVLDYLVKVGRAIPIHKYTDAGIAAPKLAAIRAAVKATADAKARREAEAASAPPPESEATP